MLLIRIGLVLACIGALITWGFCIKDLWHTIQEEILR